MGVRDKIRWSKFTMENILTSYASPIAEELNNMNIADYNSLANSAEQIKNFMLKHSAPLVTPVRNNKISKKVFFRLPDDVKSARLQGKDAFDSWKQLNFPVMFTKPNAPHGNNIGRNCAAFWTKRKLTE